MQVNGNLFDRSLLGQPKRDRHPGTGKWQPDTRQPEGLQGAFPKRPASSLPASGAEPEKQISANSPYAMPVQNNPFVQAPAETKTNPPGNDKNNEKNMVTLAGGGHGSGCGHCNLSVSGKIPKDKLAALRASQYSKIMGHEQAHAAAAGSLGGPIQINYDGNGIAFSGSVPIRMPAMSKSNPQATMRDAQTVYRAALAPGDPSGPDQAIAGQAASMMSQASSLLFGQSNNKDKTPLNPAGNPFAPKV